jgi:hypothetical protein
MGVLKESAKYSMQSVTYVTDKTGTFITTELTRTKENVAKILEMFPNFPCQLAKSAGESVMAVIDQILLLQPIAWSKQKIYALYSKLMTHLETLLITLADYVSPPMESVYSSIKMAFEKIVSFVAVTFDKLDDSLVTPIVTTTFNGIKKTYTITTDFALAKINWVKNTLVLPVTNTVTDYMVVPIYKKVTGTAQYATSLTLKTGAFIDKRLSLVGMMMALVEKSKQVDQCVTSGAITNKVVLPAIDSGKALDKYVTNGAVEDFISKSVDEFQGYKGNKPVVTRGYQANVTSAGAPVYRK